MGSAETSLKHEHPFPYIGREEGEGALKEVDMIKGQKADTCGVGLGNNEASKDEGGCQ